MLCNGPPPPVTGTASNSRITLWWSAPRRRRPWDPADYSQPGRETAGSSSAAIAICQVPKSLSSAKDPINGSFARIRIQSESQ